MEARVATRAQRARPDLRLDALMSETYALNACRPQETYVHLSSTRTKNSLLDNTPSGPVRDDSGPRFSLPADDSGQPLPSSASSQRIGPGGMLIRSGSQRSGYGPALSRSGSLRSQGAAGRGRGGEVRREWHRLESVCQGATCRVLHPLSETIHVHHILLHRDKNRQHERGRECSRHRAHSIFCKTTRGSRRT